MGTQDAKPELLSNEMALEEENLSAAQIIHIAPIHRTSNKRVIKCPKALIRFFGRVAHIVDVAFFGWPGLIALLLLAVWIISNS